jgi:hypothetical protein
VPLAHSPALDGIEAKVANIGKKGGEKNGRRILLCVYRKRQGSKLI